MLSKCDQWRVHIYKIANGDLKKKSTTASITRFVLPEDMHSEDFEAFFENDGWFYMFSKNQKKTKLIKVPNQVGEHVATLISEFELKGKGNKVTSADISGDGTIAVLLNHDKVWILTDFKGDDYFSGTMVSRKFKHDSQKEGVHLLNANELLITDELQKIHGGNIYRFLLD